MATGRNGVYLAAPATKKRGSGAKIRKEQSGYRCGKTETKRTARTDEKDFYKRKTSFIIKQNMQKSINFVPLYGFIKPEYKTEGAAAIDLQAANFETLIIHPGCRVTIPTGLKMEIPAGFYGMIAPRSGIASKNGVIAVIGIIDCDFRGEICVTLINTGDKDFEVITGDRIAQMVIMPYVKAEFVAVEELGQTERGEGGFGHTGVK